MTPLLSICIPSYNRSKYLPDLLNSIASQYDPRLEVVICDNGSTDNTQETVLLWQKNHPWIVYEKFEKNVGPDRCFLRSIEIASGTFAWLMGDDDILEPNALQIILEKLDPSLVGITVNRAAYDSTLQKRWLETIIGPRITTLFQEPSSCLKALFPLFGFLSAQIVRRSCWLSVTQEEDVTPYYNAYVLIYVIGRMIQKETKWLYLETPCVGWRSDNDSFAKELGLLGRFELDIKGYTSIIKGLCPHNKALALSLLNRVCSIHFFAHVRKLKLFSSNIFFFCFYHLKTIPSFWYKILPVLILPRTGFVFIQKTDYLA
jgi:abequosyltransferase